MKKTGLARLAAGLSSFASAIVARGGAAGYSPVHPERFVPYTSRNIGRDILKPSRNSARYVGTPKDGSREQKRFARNLAAGRYSFFDHDANRRRLALDKLNRELDQPISAITISDYEEDGVTIVADLGPVKIADEMPHPGVPISSLGSFDQMAGRADRSPADLGLKPGDLFVMRDWVAADDGKAFPAGAARDRLRDAGLITYSPTARKWSVTDEGKAFL